MAETKTSPDQVERDHQASGAAAVKEPWEKPGITSHLPANAAEGISYNPLDGLTNLTP